MSDVLLLNASEEPLNIISLQRAVNLLLAQKAEIVCAAKKVLHAETFEIPAPTVVRLLYYVQAVRRRILLNKKNVLLRDEYRCGYCGRKEQSVMTVDHVIPKSQGGPSTWQNLIACCYRCNQRKRNRTPEQAGMPLQWNPCRPKHISWATVRRNTASEEWEKYLTLYYRSIDDER